MSYQKLHQSFDGTNLFVFFDVEGTQFFHKMISIGLVCVPKKENEITFDESKMFYYHAYVKCDDEIGDVVTRMTGITPQLLEEKGKNVREVILEISKLIRPYKRKFISYGNQDLRMILNALDKNDETEINFFRNVAKNYFDFHSYLEKIICDKKGQSYSIDRLLNLFCIPKSGTSHDPLSDSINMMKIYQKYVQSEEEILKLYLENYRKNPFQNENNRELVSLLLDKKAVSIDDFIQILRNRL